MSRYLRGGRAMSRHYSTTTGASGLELSRHPVSWLKRDVLLFAASIGCKYPQELHFLYESHPRFAVFPTYPLVLPFKKSSQEVVDYHQSQEKIAVPGIPAFDSKRVVDGQREIQILKELPTSSDGRNFEIRSKILGIYDKGKPGSVVETEQTLVDNDAATVYTRMVSSKFYVGQGEWGGPRGSSAPKYPPPEGREDIPDKTCHLQLSDEIAHLYRLNGDYNPLHATPEPGEKLGMGGTIVHGLYTWNASANILLREFGDGDPARMSGFQARFAAPVRPGAKLVVRMWRMDEEVDGVEDIRFVTEADGTVVLSNGRALIKRAT